MKAAKTVIILSLCILSVLMTVFVVSYLNGRFKLVLKRFDSTLDTYLVLEDRDGKPFYKVQTNNTYTIPAKLDEVSEAVRKAVIFTEDKRFYSHHGIDIRGMVRALTRNFRRGEILEGGSTITQQVIKLKLGNSKRTVLNKIEENILALLLERRKTKDEILEAYLNVIYFGYNLHGVGSAGRVYFGKPAGELGPAEAALLASLIPHPSAPVYDRYDVVYPLQEYIYAEVFGGNEETEELLSFQEQFRFPNENPEYSRLNWNPYPYYSGYVLTLLRNRYGFDTDSAQSITVGTSFDPILQHDVQVIFSDYVIKTLFGNVSLDADPPLDGAVVVADPYDAEILAIVGGREYGYGDQYNRALQTRRRLGSVFKPFLYAAAFDTLGFSPETILSDEPVFIPDENLGIYQPPNHYYGYQGPVTLRRALSQSINTVSIKLACILGLSRVIEKTSIFFLPSDFDGRDPRRFFQPIYSTALGSASFTLLETVQAYSVFANLGIRKRLECIRSITLENGKITAPLAAAERRIISEKTALQVLDILEGVFELEGTAYVSPAARYRFSIAGKSGSITDNSWFIGLTPRYEIGVWMGMGDYMYISDYTPRYRAFDVFTEIVKKIYGDDYTGKFSWENDVK